MGKRGKADRNTVLLNYKLWLTSLTGGGRIDDKTFYLLNSLREKSTLREAATLLGLNYSKARRNIHKAESIAGYQLTEKRRGGKSGGGTKLTASGEKILEAYKSLHAKFDDTFEKTYLEYINREERTP